MKKITLITASLVLFPLAGCGGDDEEPTTGTSALSEVTCPNQTKVKLKDVADCAAYVEKWTKECCPKATADYTSQSVQAMLCTGVDSAALNSACKAALGSAAFNQACDAVKATAACK